MGRVDGARCELRGLAEGGQATLCDTSLLLEKVSSHEDHPRTDLTFTSLVPRRAKMINRTVQFRLVPHLRSEPERCFRLCCM